MKVSMKTSALAVVALTATLACSEPQTSSTAQKNYVDPQTTTLQLQQTKPKKPFGVRKEWELPEPNNIGNILPQPAQLKENKKAAVLMGLILAFNSGFVNGVCLSGGAAANGAKQAVAAVTGSWTSSALGLASGNFQQFRYLALVIASFMGGSTIAGLLNPTPPKAFTGLENQRSQEGSLSSRPFYANSLYLGAALLFMAGLQLGDAKSVKTGFLLAAMANGIQNSVTSTMTSNLCRTTHFSGITSDMGTFLGQVLRGNKTNLFKLQIGASLSACFWIGGLISYFAANQLNNNTLYISAGMYILVGSLYNSFATKFLSSQEA